MCERGATCFPILYFLEWPKPSLRIAAVSHFTHVLWFASLHAILFYVNITINMIHISDKCSLFFCRCYNLTSLMYYDVTAWRGPSFSRRAYKLFIFTSEVVLKISLRTCTTTPIVTSLWWALTAWGQTHTGYKSFFLNAVFTTTTIKKFNRKETCLKTLISECQSCCVPS